MKQLELLLSIAAFFTTPYMVYSEIVGNHLIVFGVEFWKIMLCLYGFNAMLNCVNDVLSYIYGSLKHE